MGEEEIYMFNPYSSIPILDDGDSTGWNICIFWADDKGIQNIINRIVVMQSEWDSQNALQIMNSFLKIWDSLKRQ